MALSLLSWFGDANTNERYILEILRRGRRRIDRIIPPSGDAMGEEDYGCRSYDSEEFLSVYPEWRETYHKVEKSYAAFISEVERVYVHLRQIADRARFAREVKQYFFYGVMLAWKSEEEERKRQASSGWRGIDGWEYYSSWSIRRLIKDIRELEENGSRVKPRGARTPKTESD